MKPDMSSTPRDEVVSRGNINPYILPPAYNDQMETSTYKSESHYEQESSQAERGGHWSETARSPDRLPANQEQDRDNYGSFIDESHQNQIEDQALNLSSKSNSTSSSEKKPMEIHQSDKPSKAVLKFFRGLGPDECNVANCVFGSCHHFHCAVEDCCAVFTEKHLVLTHTTFHEKLEQSGFEQPIARQFSPVFPAPDEPPRPRSPSRVTTPSSGHLPRGESDTQRNIVLSRAQFDQSRDMGNHDNGNNNGGGDYPNVSAPPPVNMASYADHPVYKYISRMVAEKKLVYPTLNPEPRSTGAYMMLQNPTLMSQAMSGSQGPSSGLGGHLDLMKKMGGSDEEGFIHIRPGMTCMRRDCKYMMQNHWHCTLNRCRYVCKSLGKAQTHRQAHDSLEAYAKAAKECFRSYTVKKMCPNPSCEFRLRGHYHCLKPGCQFVTIGTSKLPWHMKKHEKIARREASGFKYYTKKEQCGRYDCKYNGLFSHYHCIRAGCAFAFQYKHQMSTHVRKHLRRMLGRSYNGMDMTSDTTDIDHSNVDSGDDSLPLIVDEADEIEQRPGVAMDTNQATASSVTTSSFPQKPSNFMHELSRPQLAMLEQISKGRQSLAPTSGDMGSPRPVTSLHSTSLPAQLEKFPNKMPSTNGDYPDKIPEEEGNSFHFSDPEVVNRFVPLSSDEGVLDLRANYPDTDSNSNESNSKFSNDMPSTNGDSPEKIPEEEGSSFHFSDPEVVNRFVPKPNDENPSMFAKFRINNDVIEGFRRFESSENCGDTQCPHVFKVSHYHCTRDGCMYRFTGRTHMFKHQQHHERVAGLVRDDFKRFKTTQDCEVDGCQYRSTSTHFHCLRCQFKCTDSAKVGTHRRQHVKADTLEQSGFERFRGKEDCMRDTCKYRHRNTSHFHCLQPGCTYSVVGLSGIEQHANKHKRGILLAQVCTKAGQDIEYSNMSQARIPLNHADSAFSAPTSSGAYPQFNAESYARVSTHSSPVPDERASPQFNASAVVTQQFNPSLMQGNAASSVAMDLSDSLNLSVNQNHQGGVTSVMTGYHAGIGLS
uniref:Zinc finger protein castor 1 n=1 Tax=Phallusia mammillata TaxID=59560 RepID=A0A6F9D7U0_9ASCI|nr:Zinc finger protein castor 1 [Phallusia mammillata]